MLAVDFSFVITNSRAAGNGTGQIWQLLSQEEMKCDLDRVPSQDEFGPTCLQGA